MKYKSWVEETEIGLDYYSAFIKTWIAFNSWYREKYRDLGKASDREILNKVKEEPNEFRSELIHSFRNDNSYREHLDLLHVSLLATSIETANYQGDIEGISLSNIAVRNLKKEAEDTRNRIQYKITRTNRRIISKIKDSNNHTIFSCEQVDYNVRELQEKNYEEWSNLSDSQSNHLKSLYKEIKPLKSISLFDDSATEGNYIDIGGNKYIDDHDTIVEALIEVLYLLRCALFHGDIAAKEETKKVYKNAYNLLKPIMQKL